MTDQPIKPDAAPASESPAQDSSVQKPGRYEENPLDNKELKQVADSLPVKNYSDYEITLEVKSDYKDALFNDESDLDQALEHSKIEHSEVKTTAQPIEETASQENKTSTESHEEKTSHFDFSAFLAAGSESLSESNSTIIMGINDSYIESGVNLDEKIIPVQLLIQHQTDSCSEPAEIYEQKEKSLAGRLRSMAQQQFKKSKAQFDEYIGRSLPERELPLDFTFPVQKPKKEFEDLVSAYSIRKLFETKGKSALSLFKQADHDLTALNKCHMLASSRHSLLDAYCLPLVEKISEIISEFERKPILSGDSKRLELAGHCQNTFKLLVNGYKQVYSHYYESANVIYGPQRHTANATLLRLLELLLIELKLCFALHARLPASSIKAMNKLFTVIRLYEPQLLMEPISSIIDGEETSAKALYFKFQILLALDGCNITSQLYRVLHPYLDTKLALLSLIEPGDEYPAESSAEKGIFWVISHEHQGPAKTGAIPVASAPPFPSTIIDVSHFLNSIIQDYARALTQTQNRQWKPVDKYLAALKPHYAMTLLAALNEDVVRIKQSAVIASFSIYQPTQFRSFCGVDNIVAYQHFVYAQATQKPPRKGEPATALPERPKLDKVQWQISKEDDDAMFLQFDEQNATIAIDVGQLLLFIEHVSDKDDHRPDGESESVEEKLILGVVQRLERVQGNKIQLVIRKFGRQMTHAWLGEDSAAAKPVLFVLTDKAPLLILDHSIVLNGSRQCLTLPDGSQRHLELGAPRWISQRMQVLTVS